MTTVDYLPKWLRALRSGKYRQGKGELRTLSRRGRDQFCCLGVLCDIVNKSKWHLDHNDEMYIYKYGRREFFAITPDSWFGSNSMNIQNQLMSMNDAGMSFKKIANWIEENVHHVSIRKAA